MNKQLNFQYFIEKYFLFVFQTGENTLKKNQRMGKGGRDDILQVLRHTTLKMKILITKKEAKNRKKEGL